MTIVLDIAKDYSAYPAGRFAKDGDFNGENFRKSKLVPKLMEAKKAGGKLTIDIDGVRSFGSSFFEEAFGGLVRSGDFKSSELKVLMEIKCTKPHLYFFKDTIEEYIKQARHNN